MGMRYCCWTRSERCARALSGVAILFVVLGLWGCSASQSTPAPAPVEQEKPAAAPAPVALEEELDRPRVEIKEDPPEVVALKVAQRLPTLAPKGWKLYDKVQQFTAHNLYEQIDGRAELFLAYDVVGLTYASFENPADTAQSLNVSVYDMGTPTNAFGIFSVERSQGETPVHIGRAAYRSGANYYVWKGRYYVSIIASDASEEFERMSANLARSVANLLLESGEPVWGLDALPSEGLIPDSVRYFQVDAMGLEFMRDTYTAQYDKEGVAVTVFLSRRESPADAQETVSRYSAYAEKYGKAVERLSVGGTPFLSCDMGGTFDIVSQKGRLVSGATAAEDQGRAIKAATDLWRALQDN